MLLEISKGEIGNSVKEIGNKPNESNLENYSQMSPLGFLVRM
jgi:hypothetical protein